MSKPANVPENAVALPLNGQFDFYQPQAVQAIQAQVAQANAALAANWNRVVSDWTLNAAHYQELGITGPLAPVAPFYTNVETAHDPDPNSPTYNTVWVWEAPGAQLPSIPPLPSTAPSAPNTIKIGVQIAGAWYQSLVGDNCPAGFTTPPGFPAGDGMQGTFQKVLGIGNVGWWLRIGP